MSKYAYNYQPSQEEINNAWELLSKVARPELTFGIYRNSEDKQLDDISSLICSMGSFNSKNGNIIAKDFKAFFKALPRVYYQEGNPNNGNALFDKVIFNGDDYIVLQANSLEEYMSQYDWDVVRRLVENFGELWKADVAELSKEELNYGMVEYTIKFWWD